MIPALKNNENAEPMTRIYNKKEAILASRFFLTSQVDLSDIIDMIQSDKSGKERFQIDINIDKDEIKQILNNIETQKMPELDLLLTDFLKAYGKLLVKMLVIITRKNFFLEYYLQCFYNIKIMIL